MGRKNTGRGARSKASKKSSRKFSSRSRANKKAALMGGGFGKPNFEGATRFGGAARGDRPERAEREDRGERGDRREERDERGARDWGGAERSERAEHSGRKSRREEFARLQAGGGRRSEQSARFEGRGEKRGRFKERVEGRGGAGGFEPARGRNSERGVRNARGARPGDRGPHRGARGPGVGAHATRGEIRGLQRLRGTVDKNRKGFGFLIFDDRKRTDVFVPPREAEKLFHGDRVEVAVLNGQVQSVKVLEHRFREIVGRYTPHPRGRAHGGWVVYEQKRAREEVYVDQFPHEKEGARATVEPKANDWVRVKLHFHHSGPFAVTGELLEVFGTELPPSVDVSMIAAEFNLIEEHSAAAEQEARAKTLRIPGPDLEGRTDLRPIPFITIDGETARDFDDAVFVERDRSGYILWVGIADVSHYVQEGSALDQEARSRGTSVYFAERAFHMLPRALSENLCSLRPKEPRMSMVAKMFMDRNGALEKTEIYEAVIESRRRATYNEIQKEFEENGKRADWEYAPHFELYEILKKKRADRGSIDFDLPEAEVVVQPTGEVVSISRRSRLDAHRLIEEFMIAANEAVTSWMMEREWPFVYRVHAEPAAEALDRFQKLAATAGVRFKIEDSASPKVLADVVKRLDGHPAQDLLNMALLRSLKQAVYSEAHGIHFGLASEGYTHFTSPIRRYPDLVVHRLIRHALRVERKDERSPTEDRFAAMERDLASICEHCSYRERLASDAERESIKLKQVRAMLPRLGDEFDAKIIGMAEFGMFVQITDPYVEGLVSKDSMVDDAYEFNEERMVFYGRRKKRTFQVGQALRVRAIRADIDRRQVDFGLIEAAK